MSQKTKQEKKAATRKVVVKATGVGLAVSGVVALTAALYTEIMTSLVARRRSAMSEKIIEAAQKKQSPADPEAPQVPTPEHLQWERDLMAAPTELVAIRSRDRYILRAHWYPVEGARRTVILAHGWHGRWSRDFCGIAPFLHENHCNLLLIEQRCHGQSGGDLISYGIRERYDVHSWLCWLEKYHGGLPVYLCGISMGAATVLMTTGLPIAGRVRGIIADSGYSSPRAIITETLEKTIGKMAGPTVTAVNLNCKRREGFSFDDYTPLEAMEQNTEIPCLFVHGDNDTFVPWSMSVQNFHACKAPKEILIVHGAEHGLSYITDTETYQNKVLDFFAAYDILDPITDPKEKKKKEKMEKKRDKELARMKKKGLAE